MNVNDFTVGQRVVVVDSGWENCDETIGQEATVVDRTTFTKCVGVQFDFEIPEGHSCRGNGKAGFCWYYGEYSDDRLELVEQMPIEPFDTAAFLD